MTKNKVSKSVRWKKLFYSLSMIGIPVLMLPVIALGCAITIDEGFQSNDPDTIRILWYFGQNFLAGMIGWILTALADKIRNKDIDNARYSLFANILMIVGMVAVLGVFALINFALTADFFISLIAVGITYFFIWRKAPKSYAEILDKKMLTAYCIISVIVVIAFWGMKVTYNRMILVWGLFYMAACYALSQDQSNIDFMMERRKHNLEHLPDKVRGRSLKLTIIVIVIGFFCVLLAPQIGWLFSQFLTAIKIIILGILRFIWNLIPNSTGSEETEEAASSDMGDMGGMGGSDEGSPLWDYIMWPLIIVGACWLIYTYRDDIMRSLMTFWRMIRTKVKGALFSSPRRAGIMADGEGEYEDEVVEISIQEARENRDPAGFKFRQWKKSVKLWRAQPDSSEKYRSGYKLALEWLQWKKVPLQASDTPLDVLEKAKSILSENEWKSVTDWYNLIRYGEPASFPAQSVSVIEQTLSGMEKSK